MGIVAVSVSTSNSVQNEVNRVTAQAQPQARTGNLIGQDRSRGTESVTLPVAGNLEVEHAQREAGHAAFVSRGQTGNIAQDVLIAVKPEIEKIAAQYNGGDSITKTSLGITRYTPGRQGMSLFQESAAMGEAARTAVINHGLNSKAPAEVITDLANKVAADVANSATGIDPTAGSSQFTEAEKKANPLRNIATPSPDLAKNVDPNRNDLNAKGPKSEEEQKLVAQRQAEQSKREERLVEEVLRKLGMLNDPQKEASQQENILVAEQQRERSGRPNSADKNPTEKLNDMMAAGRFGTDGPITSTAQAGLENLGPKLTQNQLAFHARPKGTSQSQEGAGSLENALAPKKEVDRDDDGNRLDLYAATQDPQSPINMEHSPLRFNTENNKRAKVVKVFENRLVDEEKSFPA